MKFALKVAAAAALLLGLLAARAPAPAAGRSQAAQSALPTIEMQSEPADAALAAEIKRLTEAFLAALPAAERPADASPIRILLAPDGARFAQLAGGRSPEWAAGLILEPGRIILLDKTYMLDLGQAAVLLRHELAHVLLDRRVGERVVPRWFHEGYAQLRAGEWGMEVLWRLGRAAWTGSAIPLADLAHGFPASGPRAQLAYAESLAAVQQLARDGTSWAYLFELLEAGEPFSAALQRSRGETQADFGARFDGEIMPGFRRWGLLFGTAPLFFLMALIFLAAAWRRFRRGRGGETEETAAGGPAGELEQNEWLNRGWIDRFRRR